MANATLQQTKDAYGVLTISSVTTFFGIGATFGPFLSQGYPYGSLQIVMVSGVTGDTIALQASNDGVNFVTVAPAITVGTFPWNALIPLTTQFANSTAVPTTTLVMDSPAKYYQAVVSAANGAYNMTAILMGTRG